MAPVAPMEWPWRAFGGADGICEAREPKTRWMAAASMESLTMVPVPWALM